MQVSMVEAAEEEAAEVELLDLAVEMEELVFVDVEPVPDALLADVGLTVGLSAVKVLAVVRLSADKVPAAAAGFQ